MPNTGGLQPKNVQAEAPASVPPPPLPAPHVAAPAPAAGSGPIPGGQRPSRPAHRDGFPPERDLGGAGKALVWFFGVVLFGGGVTGWFVLCGQTEHHLSAFLAAGGMEAVQAEGINPLAGTSLAGASSDDLEFLSQELGIDGEFLGLSGGGPTEPDAAPSSERQQKWPAVVVAGVMRGRRPGDARVILNGVLVRVGDSFQGIEVVDVKNQAAALRFRDEVIWVYSGQSTID